MEAFELKRVLERYRTEEDPDLVGIIIDLLRQITYFK